MPGGTNNWQAGKLLYPTPTQRGESSHESHPFFARSLAHTDRRADAGGSNEPKAEVEDRGPLQGVLRVTSLHEELERTTRGDDALNGGTQRVVTEQVRAQRRLTRRIPLTRHTRHTRASQAMYDDMSPAASRPACRSA